MNRLLKRLYSQQEQLSVLEKEVLEYVLSHGEEVIHQSIEELSDQLHISSATISRAAKHLGFTGFNELKFAIRQQKLSGEHSSDEEMQLDWDSYAYKQLIIHQIETSFNRLSEPQIEQIHQMIERSERIEIFAVGWSYSLAFDMSKKLNFLGNPCHAALDWDDLRQAGKLMKSTDLAIMISLSGETHHIIEYAEAVIEHQTPILALVGSEDSLLEKMATHTLVAQTNFENVGAADLSSRIAMQALADYLLLSYGKRK